MQIVKTLVLVSLAVVLNCGCAEQIRVSVMTYADPAANLTQGRRFTTVAPPAPNGGLLESELLQVAQQNLSARGFIYDPANPDLVLTLQYTERGVYYYNPPSYAFWPGVWYGGRHVGVFVPPGATEWPGSTELRYARSINVWIGDAHQTIATGGVGPQGAKLIWQGTVGSDGRYPDWRAVAWPMLQQLMGEFPVRTALPMDRKVPFRAPSPVIVVAPPPPAAGQQGPAPAPGANSMPQGAVPAPPPEVSPN